MKTRTVTNLMSLWGVAIGSGTESDSDDSVPDLEEQDSAQAQTQQAQVRPLKLLSVQKRAWYKLSSQ